MARASRAADLFPSRRGGPADARDARPCGARCSASKFDDAASARGRDLMMRTAGAHHEHQRGSARPD